VLGLLKQGQDSPGSLSNINMHIDIAKRGPLMVKLNTLNLSREEFSIHFECINHTKCIGFSCLFFQYPFILART
jgi:hypothetical protein